MSTTIALSGTRAAAGVAYAKPKRNARIVAVEKVASQADDVAAETRAPQVLDVRGAAIPAQSGRTLAVLESLEIGRSVLHVNTFVPWSLLPLLQTRGVRYHFQSREPGDVRILMWRHWEPSGASPCGLRRERIRSL